MCANTLITLALSFTSSIIQFPARVAVVRMEGIIYSDAGMHGGLRNAMLDANAAGDGAQSAIDTRMDLPINLRRFESKLTRAFQTAGCRAVALVIDSPGGSPAQSSLLYSRLRALRQQYPRVKLIAFVEDSAASGGYYIACAADEIVADHNSIVGSIGVISTSFGYVRAIARQGMTRRVFTAGDSKAGIDAYLPVKFKDLQRQKHLMKQLHSNFIAAVKDGRGDRLQPEVAASLAFNTTAWSVPGFRTPSNSTLKKLVNAGAGLFDGSTYSGATAVELGLVDRLGDYRTDLRKVYGRMVSLIDIDSTDASLAFWRLLRHLLTVI